MSVGAEVAAGGVPGAAPDDASALRRGPREAARASTAPWLIIAVGNPSRGDDALGPALVERLECTEGASDDVEYLVDFQLQVEHALDLAGRRGVLFVDAARAGVLARDARRRGRYALDGAVIAPIEAASGVPPGSHALGPEAVLHVAGRFDADAPPAWQLAIEGAAFGLGEGLSEAAEAHLEEAFVLARRWLAERRDGEVRRRA